MKREKNYWKRERKSESRNKHRTGMTERKGSKEPLVEFDTSFLIFIKYRLQ